jgi:hypothetical protein
MTTMLRLRILATIFVLGAIVSPSMAQNFKAILDEVTAVEKRLARIIEQESSQRKTADKAIMDKVDTAPTAQSGRSDSALIAGVAEIKTALAQNSIHDDSITARILVLSQRVDSLAKVQPDGRVLEMAQMLQRLIGEIKLALVKTTPAAADGVKSDQKPKIDVGGTLFAHYSYDFSENPALDYDGVSIERAYVDVKAKLNERISGRLTIDLNPKDSTYKYMFLKFAYAEYAIPAAGLSFRVGQQDGHWPGCVDKAWKYRSIEKTLSDYNKVLTSADLGITALYTLPKGYGEAIVQLLNGNSFRNTKAKEESNFQKDVAIRVSLKPMPANKSLKGLSVHAGFQYKNDAGLPSTVLTGLTAWDGAWFSAGAELLSATKKDTATGTSEMRTLGWSLFCDIPLPFHKSAGALLRYDAFDPDDLIDKDGGALFIAGGRYLLGGKHALAIVYQKQSKEKVGVKPVALLKCVLEAKF